MIINLNTRIAFWGLILIGLFGISLSACLLFPEPKQEVIGRVLDGETLQPIDNAIITLRASPFQTGSNPEGGFYLLVPLLEGEVEITAWAPGYYTAAAMINPPIYDLSLELRPLPSSDHPGYTWIDPTAESSEKACGNCHPLILPQWAKNAHGGAVFNTRFFSFYNGTDTDGGSIQASGYLKDFPGTSGNCAACHAPGAAVNAPFSTDMNQIRGEIMAGIMCDYCHKVVGGYLNPADQRVYANSPGVLSTRLLRPPEGDQIFIGPFPDIPDPDTYLPLFSQSAYCAPCHQFSFWGTEIYNSYGEWLDSDYAERGMTCQACHMPPSGEAYFAPEDQGGLAHPPGQIPSHFQLGVTDTEFMNSALTLDVIQKVENDQFSLRVILNNTGAGHHFPTDHPGRHLILVIKVFDQTGTPIPLSDGPLIPDWAGDLAGNPGMVYAKVLKDARSGDYPVVHYWKPTLIQSDNRLPANGSRETSYLFDLNGEPVSVQIQVLFRRLYQPLAEVYGWEVGEIILAEESFNLQP